MRTIRLTPPIISPEHIKEKIVCIRGHRERIFRVEPEQLKDKLIFHNYGQGGAGWTFLFGCANESLRQFEEKIQHNNSLRNQPVCVIGAGCYGMLTAIMLARSGYQVRIIAKETENIPSYKAAGFFFPRPRTSSTEAEKKIFAARGLETYKTYLDIIQGYHPFIKKGPKLIPSYFGLDIDPGFAPYLEANLIPPPEKVRIDFGKGTTYEIMCYQSLFINPPILIQELQRVLRELSIPIVTATVNSFEDLDESIIFNCAGLGAKTLASDQRMVPVQGHLISLHNQPPLDQLQYLINVKVVMTDHEGKNRDELIYYAPNNSGIIGITFKRGTDSLTANSHEFDRLVTRCQDFFGIQ